MTPRWPGRRAGSWWPNTARRAPASAPEVTAGELLESYIGSAQLWKPATAASHRHVVSTLLGDPLCRCRLQSLTPAVTRAAICRWREDGVSVPKVSARWLLLRAAVSWAVAEDLLRLNPLAGMHGPPRPQPRRHHSQDEVRRLLAAADDAVASAQDAVRRQPGAAACARRLFAAEQSLLLVRLAADCGARRGELAVLRLSDLDGRVLTIERSLSAGVLGPTKSGRTRRMTLGSGTADMIRRHFQAWAAREEPEGDWLFSPSPRRSAYITAGALSRRLARLGLASGVGMRLCTGSATAWPPTWWARGCCSRPRPASATGTPPPPCGTTPMPSRSTTPTRPTSLTAS